MRKTHQILAGIVAVASMISLAAPAHAHTRFDHSTPDDGASVPEPVSEIAVAFTLPVTVVGNGFLVLDPRGNIVEPRVTTDDDRVFTLDLPTALTDGDVGVRYEVAAEDGHVLAGAFSFTVTPSAPSTTTTEPAPDTTTTTTHPTTTTTGPATNEADASTTSTTPVTAPATTRSAGATDPGGSGETVVIGAGAILVTGALVFALSRRRGT